MAGPIRVGLGCVFALLGYASHAQDVIHDGYHWHAVGEGIFVHSQVNPLTGPVDGNSVVIVGDDGVVVVDTHINPAVTRSVIARIRELTDAPVTHVVNTHWHDDHTNGNHEYRKAFPEVQIVAHQATLESLREEWQAMEDQRREGYASIDIPQLLAEADRLAADDPDTAISFRVYAGYVEALRPELPELVLEYPDTVFGDSMQLDIGGRIVELRWLGRGNTNGDVVVWLPDDKVVITGDILVAPIPYAFSSPMVEWTETLARLRLLDAEIIIPGHGAIQHGDAYLETVRELLIDTLQAVRDAREAGVGYADLASKVDLRDHEARFTGDDPELGFAWRAYFLSPGLNSAWTSLGYPVPDDEAG